MSIVTRKEIWTAPKAPFGEKLVGGQLFVVPTKEKHESGYARMVVALRLLDKRILRIAAGADHVMFRPVLAAALREPEYTFFGPRRRVTPQVDPEMAGLEYGIQSDATVDGVTSYWPTSSNRVFAVQSLDVSSVYVYLQKRG